MVVELAALASWVRNGRPMALLMLVSGTLRTPCFLGASFFSVSMSMCQAQLLLLRKAVAQCLRPWRCCYKKPDFCCL